MASQEVELSSQPRPTASLDYTSLKDEDTPHMELLQDAIHNLIHLDETLNQLAAWAGPWLYVILFAIIFAETGLVATPFLPGDSLLFAVGALAATPGSTLNLPLVAVLLCIAAITGDAVNYAIGAKFGPAVFRSETSWLLNKRHLEEAQRFYEKHGGKTIVLARFIPIVRTFAPFVAGIGRMSYARFALFNVSGGIVWVLLFLLAGYWFGGQEFVKKQFHYVILGIIVISLLPAIWEFLRARRGSAVSESTAVPASESK
jgi:membrane-associated protein